LGSRVRIASPASLREAQGRLSGLLLRKGGCPCPETAEPG
jgi:hypothetical protein